MLQSVVPFEFSQFVQTAVVKSFEYKIAISANFVQTVKNSIGLHPQLNVEACFRRIQRNTSEIFVV